MVSLEDLFGKGNEDPFNFGKKKKPKEDLLDYSIILHDYFNEDLMHAYRDLGIDLGREREDDDKLGKRKRGKYEGLEEYVDSAGLLSSFLNNPNEEIIKKFHSDLSKYDVNKNIIKSIKEEYFDFGKELMSKYINYNTPNLLSSKFISIQTSPLGLNLTMGDSASITAENIGEFALPIVEYIHQTQPDYVVASDRGARLLGLAVFRLHKRLYGRFPTADGSMRFRRFSKSNTSEATEQHLQPLVNEMLQYKKRPTVLVLDDWVCSGGTKKLAQQTFDKLSRGRIKTKFGVLIGGGADISGHGSQTSGFAGVTDWRDDSNIIGIKYGKDNWGSTGIIASPVRSEQARDYRRRMYQGIDKLVERLVEKRESVTDVSV